MTTIRHRHIWRAIAAMVAPLAALGIAQVPASAATPAPDAAPTTAVPATTAPVPPGYVQLLDDLGRFTITVPETWNDVVTTPNVADDGSQVSGIAASTDVALFDQSFAAPGVRFFEYVFHPDPQILIDQYGLTAGCASFAVEPFASATFTGLVQVGTGCGDTGEALYKMVVASPADQSMTAVLLAHVPTAAEQEAMDIALQSFSPVGAVTTPTTTPSTSGPGSSASSTAPTPGLGLDGDVDLIPAATAGEITIVGVFQVPATNEVVIFFRNGTEQPITQNVLTGQILGPDGSVVIEFTEADFVSSNPEVVDPGGAGVYVLNPDDVGNLTLPAGFTYDLTVNPNPAATLVFVQNEVVALDAATKTITLSNDYTEPLTIFPPSILCLDDAGTPLEYTAAPWAPGSDPNATTAPGATAQFVWQFQNPACTNVVITSETIPGVPPLIFPTTVPPGG